MSTFPEVLGELFATFYPILIKPAIDFVERLWWLWLFIASFFLIKNLWLHYRRALYKKAIRWTLLEIQIPSEVRKSPKAMEQVFAQIHSLRNTPNNWQDKYIAGEVTLWFSLEVVAFGGEEIHFYIRTPARFRNIIEAHIYASYKDVEVVEVADYVDRLPAKTNDLYRMGLEMMGLELALRRDDAYPIRTYMEYESMEEEKSLDPLSGLIEILSKFKKGEQLWLQILVKPVGSEWKEAGDKLVRELKEKSISRVKIGKDEETVTISRSPGETAVIEAIEKNIAKSGFETIIRYVYISPRSIFNWDLAFRGVRGAFTQYSTQNLNSFRLILKTLTAVWWGKFPYFFPKKRREARKQAILRNYRMRRMPEEMGIGKAVNSQFFYWDTKSKSFIFNTEELATIFHPPSYLVLTAPFIKRVEAKRLGPPAGLEIFGEEEEV
ncbi:hypothetical protein IIA95_00995, partial [Patescibacteria group bacterium]|nr:hypothetical protein [Patescibacteria group bacterium]